MSVTIVLEHSPLRRTSWSMPPVLQECGERCSGAARQVSETRTCTPTTSPLGALRDRTHCITLLGEQTKAHVVSMRLGEGDKLTIEGLALDVIYTPGHTDDSYSFVMPDRVFTGDTLLIRGTGRTDFQNGDPRQQYESIFGRLLKLPDATLVYPAHDYRGDTVSTIGEERAYNPRLQVKSVDEYVGLMNNLKLPNPKMMDVAVPANMRVGLAQEEIARRGWTLSAGEALALLGKHEDRK